MRPRRRGRAFRTPRGERAPRPARPPRRASRRRTASSTRVEAAHRFLDARRGNARPQVIASLPAYATVEVRRRDEAPAEARAVATPREALPGASTATTLVLLAVCERGRAVIDDNISFFLAHGCGAGYGVSFDVCVIANGHASPALSDKLNAVKPSPRLIERENEGGDFGAWGAALDTCRAYERYVFLNDTVRGPFAPRGVQFPRRASRRFPRRASRRCALPRRAPRRRPSSTRVLKRGALQVPRYLPPSTAWPDAFCGRLDARVKLVGSTLNRMSDWEARFREPHVQSMAWATDQTGLELLKGEGIFSPEPLAVDLITSCDALKRGAARCSPSTRVEDVLVGGAWSSRARTRPRSRTSSSTRFGRPC